MLIDVFAHISHDVVLVVFSAVLEQLAQLIAEKLQPLEHMLYIGLLIQGAVAIRILSEKAGDDGLSILQQGDGQIQDIAGGIQCLHIMPRMIPEQIAERLDRVFQNIRIIFLKCPGKIILEQADVEGISAIFPGMIRIEKSDSGICIGILENLSRILIRITDRTGGLNRGTDTTAQGNIIILLQGAADALQSLCQIYCIVSGICGIREAEDQCKMAQIQRQCVKRQIFSPQLPDHLQGSGEQRNLLFRRQLVGLGT